MAQNQSLSELWKAHLNRPYPGRRPLAEYGHVDSSELVGFDTFVAGLVSRVVDGGQLSAIDRQSLFTLSLELNSKLPALSGDVLDYFRALHALANAALASQPKH
jgi:hypothetical protein